MLLGNVSTFCVPPCHLFKTPYADMKDKRQTLALHSLSRAPPTSEEAAELHTFFLTYGQEESAEKKERVWMGDTRLC